jgi:chromosome segregation ATPase
MINTTESDTDDEIKALTAELQQLTFRSNQIASRLRTLNRDRSTLLSSPRQQQTERVTQARRNRSESKRRVIKGPLQVGERVEVISTHKNRKGIRGTIAQLTSAQATIEPDNCNISPFRVFKANLKRLR